MDGNAQRIEDLEATVAALTDEVGRLQDAVAARDSFLAIAAHELRNPMTPIALRVQKMKRLLASDPLAKEAIEDQVDAIERSVDVFLKRAKTLLDVSRVTAGTLSLDSLDVDIADVARGVVQNLQLLTHTTHGPLELTAPTSVVVRADPMAVEQILENLVSNAIKYGNGSPVHIGVTSQPGSATIRVTDGGPGISSEDQARIFRRFERAAGVSRGTGGFGVGLWLVRELAEAMGGSVVVASTPGQGTTFSVQLPHLASPAP